MYFVVPVILFVLQYFMLLSLGCSGTFSPVEGVSASSGTPTSGASQNNTPKIIGHIPTGILNLGATMLSQTNLFTDTTNLTPAEGLLEYSVNVPLWTDGAVKRRWIALPDTSQITFNSTGAWTFPIGTVLVKLFSMPKADGTTVRMETRILSYTSVGWTGYSYQWSADGSDATLLIVPATSSLQISDPNNPTASIAYTYSYPTNQCMTCHNSLSGTVLGVNTFNINGPFASGGTNQLTTWEQGGMFTAQIPDPTTLASYPAWKDPAADAQDEARAYLSVNCSHCHQPGGPSGQNFDLRYATALANANIIDVAPAIPLGLTNEARIRSGASASSTIFARMSSSTISTRMPASGSTVVDPSAISVMATWINGL